MNTKKLKSFEYAGKVHSSGDEPTGLHRQEAFNTSFGHVMVVVATEGRDKKQEELAGIVAERMRYYMDHADDEQVEDITTSALKYSNGYICQLVKKDPTYNTPARISCLCLLNHENTLHYAWAGDQVCMALWDGKKVHPLLTHGGDTTQGLPEQVQVAKPLAFVGQEPQLSPRSAEIPLKPLSGDCILLGTGPICQHLFRKDVRKVMQDSMPLQTKLLRIMGLFEHEAARQPASLMMISYYHVDHTTRVFMGERENESSLSRGTLSGASRVSGSSAQQKSNSVQLNTLKYAMIVLAGILVGYMVYDLFVFDPKPPIRLPSTSLVETHDTIVDVPGEALEELDAPPPFPEDELYTVRGGDTWSRVYRQYQVCSWFIINHPRNTGRFGRGGSLIAGHEIHIPVRYSGDPERNPNYYHEFTTSEVGRGCENVDQEFLNAFHEKYDSQ